MSAAEINAAQLSGTLGAASLSGALSTGAVVLNDYAIAITPIDGGHRLTITRGSDVQTLDIMDGVGGGGADVPIASETVAGRVRVGGNLKISADGTLSVDTVAAVEQDNTRPITSAAVYTEVGNINALLETI